MAISDLLKRTFTWWNGQTFGTQIWTARRGVRVGEDAVGNVYYRTADDSSRWVIYSGEVEATRVPNEWFGWLHRTWDEPPTERPLVRRAWEKPSLPNLTGTQHAYAPPGSLRRVDPVKRQDYEAWTPE
ncbi:NADH:ubiquinone oxidoreductase subunit NDUFA12 [Rubellimicrobium aerolatum]|uniref:NADH:ubiquinone oxidoreductase subunit NDUFA12 n=1 Tax=Rubellimicrobium aerolatum TaxID=490979 RepID=A0ABW0S602_9RHOB|nr:NADH:ubiquinone oxidoreductase subunit NDUFA12 [Rubellimicrobium aerolatum]MBP1804548.1 NADH:ubiquinone oxidoreductase subunit [Rubellimicrobium aerolatum]